MCSSVIACSTTGQNPSHAEAQKVESLRRLVPTAVSRPAVPGGESPEPAADGPERSPGRPFGITPARKLVGVQVSTPFAHVAVHVVKPPRIRPFLTHRMGVVLADDPRGFVEPSIVGVRNLPRQRNSGMWSLPGRRIPIGLRWEAWIPIPSATARRIVPAPSTPGKTRRHRSN
jgi:hypothetical protein